MRLIDADALSEAIEREFDGVCVYDVTPSEAISDFQSVVDRQPTIQLDKAQQIMKIQNGIALKMR